MKRLYPVLPLVEALTRFPSDGRLIERRPACRYLRRPARILNEGFLTPAEVAEQVRVGFGRLEQDVPAEHVAWLPDALLLRHGVVVTASGCVIEETLFQVELATLGLKPVPGEAALTGVPGAKGKTIEGASFLMRKVSDINYGHWLVEVLPKLALLPEIATSSPIRYVVAKGPAQVRESLALSGVEPHEIFVHDEKPRRFRELIYVSPLTCHPTYRAPDSPFWKSPRTVEFLDSVVTRWRGPSGRPRRVFLSRYPATSRGLANEEELAKLAEAHGFVRVMSGKLSFREQIACFADAEVVVGTFGAAMTNIALAPRGARVVVLAPPYVPGLFYWDLACLKEQPYWQVHGRALGSGRFGEPFVVSAKDVGTLLEEACTAS